MLVVKEGHSDGASLLTTYNIDIAHARSEKVTQVLFDKPFESSLRTKSHLLLASDDQTLFALNPLNLENKLSWRGKSWSHGINDDYVLNDKNELADLQSSHLEWYKV